jgi:hypothetical protein
VKTKREAILLSLQANTITTDVTALPTAGVSGLSAKELEKQANKAKKAARKAKASGASKPELIEDLEALCLRLMDADVNNDQEALVKFGGRCAERSASSNTDGRAGVECPPDMEPLHTLRCSHPGVEKLYRLRRCPAGRTGAAF